MSLHIEAKVGEVARAVLITGDPLRAKYHAETWLNHPVCYNRIRGMYGYTGTYRGQPVSIQGTGMGIPSTALYMHELIHEYGVTCIIRVGTCGALQKSIQLGQVILATEAGTDSKAVQHYVTQPDGKPQADLSLLNRTKEIAHGLNISVKAGIVFSTDLFYSEDPHRYEEAVQQGVLAADMETSMVYAMARYFSIRSMSLLTVSDNILTGACASAEDRELRTTDMIRLALEVAAVLA